MWIQNNAVHKIIEFAYKKLLNQNIKEDFDLKNKQYVNRLKNNFLAANHHYLTGDEFDEVIELIRGNLLKKYESANLLYIYFEFSSMLLAYHAGEVRIDMNYLFDYVSMTNKVSKEIIIAAYSAQKPGSHNNEYIMKTTNQRIDNILKKGLYENHMHLKGSGCTCELSMLTIFQEGLLNCKTLSNYVKTANLSNNDVFYQNMDSEQVLNYLKKIILLRMIIEKQSYQKDMNETKINDLKQAMLQDEYFILSKDIIGVDNLEKNRFENMEVDKFLEEEYRFKTDKIFKMSLRNQSDLWYYNKYLELITKIKFLIIQDDVKIGFENFKRYESNKEGLISCKNQTRIIKSVFYKYYLDSYVESIEIRIAPPERYHQRIKNLIRANNDAYQLYLKNDEDFQKYLFDYKLSNMHISDEEYEKLYREYGAKNGISIRKKIKIGVIIHFIKNKYPIDTAMTVYDWKYIYEQNNKQNNKLLAFIESSSEYKNYLIGIDTANYENTIRPYVFTNIYEEVKEQASKYKHHLGFTYHAGEAFITPASGIRAIDEVIEFLNYQNGDRIGHALALGTNITKFSESKKYKFVQSRGEYLDDIIWMYEALSEKKDAKYSHYLQYLSEKYEEYAIEVVLSKEKFGMSKIKPTLMQYRLSWYLRGDGYQDNERKYYSISFQSKYMQAKNDTFAKVIHNNYSYDKSYIEKRHERIYEKFDDTYIKCTEVVQSIVREKIANLGIIIETNPTSNYKISEISKYNELQLFDFIDNDKPLTICINTDDSGIFDTNLQNEYYLVYAAACERYQNQETVYNLLSNLRKMGKVASFIKE